MTELPGHTNSAGTAKLWLLNLLGNAAALVAVYYWLVIPDAQGWQVAASAVIALAVVFLVAWLRAGTFAYFRLMGFRQQSELWPAFRRALKNLLPLIIWVALFAVLIWLIWSLRVYTPQFGVWLRQKLNAGPSPRLITRTANWLIILIECVLLPAVVLPVASTIPALGLRFSNIKRSLRVLKRGGFWLWLCLLLLVGGYLPYRLVWWIPTLDTLRAQAWSMGLRFFAAYLLAVTAWIALVWMVGVLGEREDGPHSDGEQVEMEGRRSP
jgi:hypothetical protein